jgi:two-component sensor histidine kinase/HAMP domain-containing protein
MALKPSISWFLHNPLSSIRVRILLLILLAFIPALLLILYNAREQRREDIQEAQVQALSIVSLASSRQNQLIDDTHQLLSFLSLRPAIQTGDGPACSAYLAELLLHYPSYTGFVAADLNGDLYCSAIPLPAAASVAGHPHFEHALLTRDFSVGDYQVGTDVGGPFLAFAYPVIEPQGALKGVIFATLDIGWLNEFSADTGLPAGSTIAVIDSRGTVLSRYPNGQDWVGKSALGQPLVQHVLSSNEGVFDGVGLESEERLFAFTRLGGPSLSGDVYIALGIPKALALEPAEQALQRNLLGLAITFALAIAIVLFGAELFMVRFVRTLVDATRKLAAGNLSHRIGQTAGPGELRHLSDAFDQMAHQLEQREEDRLKAEESRAQLARERARRERSEVLLREIDHRVKNSLQIAASLISLQARNLQDPQTRSALKDSESRIRTMANIHARLRLSNDNTLVDFQSYLQEVAPAMLQAHTNSSKVNLKVTSDRVLLNVEKAVPCALIVNELVTNAIKHAFPGDKKGTIHVQFTNGDGRCTLTVADDGVGLPEDLNLQTASSLGYQLVNALTLQLHGALDLQRNGGASVSVSFPHSAANIP